MCAFSDPDPFECLHIPRVKTPRNNTVIVLPTTLLVSGDENKDLTLVVVKGRKTDSGKKDPDFSSRCSRRAEKKERGLRVTKLCVNNSRVEPRPVRLPSLLRCQRQESPDRPGRKFLSIRLYKSPSSQYYKCWRFLYIHVYFKLIHLYSCTIVDHLDHFPYTHK